MATPEGSKYSDKALRITNTQVARLEKEIDIHNKKLDELKSFVLPGGTKLSSWFHLQEHPLEEQKEKLPN